jgi:hypothetical protein
MKRLKYESIKVSSREEIEAVISRDDPNELLYAVISAALYSEDPDWAEDVCVRLSQQDHFNVRGNAILGVGHIARIHKKLTEKRVKPLIESALKDESEYVRGHANSAADDVNFFLKWKIKHPR